MKTKIILLFLALLSIPAAQAQTCGAAPHCVILSWVASVDTSTTGYNIYRQVTTGTCPASVTNTTGFTKVNSTPIVGLTYTDTTAQNPSTDCYVGTATNAAGESGPSNVASATVSFPPSAPPTVLGAVSH